jgi:hypothetical protein
MMKRKPKSPWIGRVARVRRIAGSNVSDAAQRAEPETAARGFFRSAEISTAGMAGNRNPIVHTAAAFNPTAQEAARQETA